MLHMIYVEFINIENKNILFKLLQVFVGEQTDAALQAAALDRNPGILKLELESGNFQHKCNMAFLRNSSKSNRFEMLHYECCNVCNNKTYTL